MYRGRKSVCEGYTDHPFCRAAVPPRVRRLQQSIVDLTREFEYLKAKGFADTGSYSCAGPKRGEVFFPTQVTRLNPEGPVALNRRFQAALPAPWSNYFLVNAHWPTGARQVEGKHAPGPLRRRPASLR